MDISGGLNKLLQNRLFMQYLSSAGAGIAQTPTMQILDSITQQNIGAQSQSGLNQKYMQMLQGMMSGKIPEGGKVVQTDKGTKIEIPQMALESIGAGAGGGMPSGQGMAVPSMGQVSNFNPFQPSQPGISAADLAGLGPQDVGRALSNAINVEALRQQTIARGVRDPLDENFPIPHPEAGTMSLRQWKSLPAEEREFASYVHAAKKLGAPKEELTRRFFSTLEPTEREQFVRAAMKDPSLMKATKELATAGATRISIGEKVAGKVAEKKALGKLKGQLWFDDPDWIDSVSEHLGDVGIQREVFMESQREGGDPELIKTKEAIKFIERKISVGGTIQDVKLSKDGRTMIWTVKWKSGDVEDISYVVRP